MSNTPSLLPCPFCGSKAVASINKGESLWSHDVVDWTRVHCTNDDCNAQTEATCEGYESPAIEVWNRRTPQPVVRELLTDREIKLLDGMIHAQLNHAQRCDSIPNRPMAEKQKSWDIERASLLQKLKAAHGITQKGGSNAE